LLIAFLKRVTLITGGLYVMLLFSTALWGKSFGTIILVENAIPISVKTKGKRKAVIMTAFLTRKPPFYD